MECVITEIMFALTVCGGKCKRDHYDHIDMLAFLTSVALYQWHCLCCDNIILRSYINFTVCLRTF